MMELIFWSIVVALAIYGLLDLIFMICLPLELLKLLHDRYIQSAFKKLKEK